MNLFGPVLLARDTASAFDRPRFSKPCVSILSYERLAQEAARGFSVLLPSRDYMTVSVAMCIYSNV
jgi:hypothetical protein